MHNCWELFFVVHHGVYAFLTAIHAIIEKWVKFYFQPLVKNSGNKISLSQFIFAKIKLTIMSNVKQFEVKVQLQGGRTTTTVIFAENDFKARELIRMQFGAELASIHYVREIR
jgi:hypothetical protein